MSTAVNPPMVGKLVSIDVQAGDKVSQNDVVATIEAMKMFVKIYAPVDGVVKAVNAAVGEVVKPDMAIITIE